MDSVLCGPIKLQDLCAKVIARTLKDENVVRRFDQTTRSVLNRCPPLIVESLFSASVLHAQQNTMDSQLKYSDVKAFLEGGKMRKFELCYCKLTIWDLAKILRTLKRNKSRIEVFIFKKNILREGLKGCTLDFVKLSWYAIVRRNSESIARYIIEDFLQYSKDYLRCVEVDIPLNVTFVRTLTSLDRLVIGYFRETCSRTTRRRQRRVARMITEVLSNLSFLEGYLAEAFLTLIDNAESLDPPLVFPIRELRFYPSTSFADAMVAIMSTISVTCPYLEHLTMPLSTENVFVALSENRFSTLRSLTLTFVRGFFSGRNEVIRYVLNTIGLQLEYLVFLHGTCFIDLAEISRQCPNLKELKVSTSLILYGNIPQHPFQNLRVIKLNLVHPLDNEFLYVLLHYFPKLKRVHLSCPRILDDDTVNELVLPNNTLLDQIEYVDIHYSSLTSRGVSQLKERCKKLTGMHVTSRFMDDHFVYGKILPCDL